MQRFASSLFFFLAFFLYAAPVSAAIGDPCSLSMSNAEVAQTCGSGLVCKQLGNAEPRCALPNNTNTGNTAGNESGQASTGTLINPLKAGSIPELLALVLEGVVQIGSIILVLMLVWVGFLFVMAQGSEEKIKSARQALMWTIIGGLILLGAQAIATLIESTVSKL